MRVTAKEKLAGALVLIEGIGLAVLVIWQILAMLSGDTESLVSAIALVVLSAVFAAAVIAFGIATMRGISWGRSGGIVTQILILAVALGAVTGEFADPSVALMLAAPAVIVFVLLVIASRAAGARRDSDEAS